MNLLDVPSKGKVIFEDNELTQHNVHLDNLRQKWVYFKILIYFLIKGH